MTGPDLMWSHCGKEGWLNKIKNSCCCQCLEECCRQHVCCVAVKVKDEELEQQKKIDEAAKKIERLLTQPSNTSVNNQLSNHIMLIIFCLVINVCLLNFVKDFKVILLWQTDLYIDW